MPQTSRGAGENQPWIQFMRQCAKEYHAQRAAEHTDASSGDSPPAAASKRRVTGKQAPSAMVGAKPKAKAAKPAKPIIEKDQKALNKQVKQRGKARAKAKAKEADAADRK